MAEAPDWILTEYRSGDEKEILGLFARGFGKARTAAHWNWKFKDNPYHPPIAVLARAKAGQKLVGQYTVMPTRLNFRGHPVQACQSLDTLVDSDFRMRGIFETSAARCFEELARKGFEVVYGFPNTHSYPGFVRKLEWKRICVLTHLVSKLDLRMDLERVLKLKPIATALNSVYRRIQAQRIQRELQRRKSPAQAFESWESVPKEYDGFWREVCSQEILSVWKDAQYLKWRYEKNPDHRFRYFGLLDQGRISAFSVVMETDPNHWICELLASGRDAALAQQLVAEIRKFYFDRGVRCLEFMGFDNGFFKKALRGFRSRRTLEELVFCGRVFKNSELLAKFSQPENWSITFGDVDSA